MSVFKIGQKYKTQSGEMVEVIGRITLLEYECVKCSDGKYRYDRSNHSLDAGRVTGTPHDYSCPDNFKKGLLHVYGVIINIPIYIIDDTDKYWEYTSDYDNTPKRVYKHDNPYSSIDIC